MSHFFTLSVLHGSHRDRLSDLRFQGHLLQIWIRTNSKRFPYCLSRELFFTCEAWEHDSKEGLWRDCIDVEVSLMNGVRRSAFTFRSAQVSGSLGGPLMALHSSLNQELVRMHKKKSIDAIACMAGSKIWTLRQGKLEWNITY